MIINKNLTKEFIPRTFSDIVDNFINTVETKERFFFPSIDVVEDEKAYKLLLVIPGVSKEEIKVEIADGKLSIKAERKQNKEEGKKYHITEIPYGVFARSFHIPDGINTEGIEASYTEGILALSLPKDEKRVNKAVVQVK